LQVSDWRCDRQPTRPRLTADGRTVRRFILSDETSRITAKVITLGATLNELWVRIRNQMNAAALDDMTYPQVPDRNGEVADVVLGFDEPSGGSSAHTRAPGLLQPASACSLITFWANVSRHFCTVSR
jgi:hypothetical protein